MGHGDGVGTIRTATTTPAPPASFLLAPREVGKGSNMIPTENQDVLKLAIPKGRMYDGVVVPARRGRHSHQPDRAKLPAARQPRRIARSRSSSRRTSSKCCMRVRGISALPAPTGWPSSTASLSSCSTPGSTRPWSWRPRRLRCSLTASCPISSWSWPRSTNG